MINKTKWKFHFDVEIPILIDNSFPFLKHTLFARGYHAYLDLLKPLTGQSSL